MPWPCVCLCARTGPPVSVSVKHAVLGARGRWRCPGLGAASVMADAWCCLRAQAKIYLEQVGPDLCLCCPCHAACRERANYARRPCNLFTTHAHDIKAGFGHSLCAPVASPSSRLTVLALVLALSARLTQWPSRCHRSATWNFMPFWPAHACTRGSALVARPLHSCPTDTPSVPPGNHATSLEAFYGPPPCELRAN